MKRWDRSSSSRATSVTRSASSSLTWVRRRRSRQRPKKKPLCIVCGAVFADTYLSLSCLSQRLSTGRTSRSTALVKAARAAGGGPAKPESFFVWGGDAAVCGSGVLVRSAGSLSAPCVCFRTTVEWCLVVSVGWKTGQSESAVVVSSHAHKSERATQVVALFAPPPRRERPSRRRRHHTSSSSRSPR